MEDTEQELTKYERKQLRKQEKKRQRLKAQRIRRVRKLVGWIVVVVFVIITLGVGVWKLSSSSSSSDTSREALLTINDADHSKGKPDASVTLIEYLDFECEACGAYYPLVKRLSEEYNEEILFVSRYYPLPGHKNGMPSALAVEAAGKQGKYWEMHDLLFEEQQTWGEQSSSDQTIFERYAEQLGLNVEQFRQDIESSEVRDRVIKDRNSGNRLGVNSTPTFFLNGEKIQNPRGYEAFKSLLDNALGR